ncbi:hypothetical protein PHMEG_00011548 [Phytophthora megakarya]|uniref:Uncharacterized protein n=1 Tax=Phytophthora megakarya TaxID=4795 RepID=A0A225WAZ8_9STRA|nr:hypothetical protein PHMEG_00011548 [Phytophthora megakarya]
MAQGAGSYYDDYMRSNAMLKHCSEKNAKKLLTDRNAYISFLEVQLERVSTACLTTQAFEKRLAALENAQVANDQKLGSLSKVFRLNQEYVEQTSQQAQTELAAYTAKVDAWMEKFSAELERQQPRMDTLEEQFRQCQDYLPCLVDANDAALHDVKLQAKRDIDELKAQVFVVETTIEEMHSCQETMDSKELALIRSSVSEKSFQLKETTIQLSNDLQRQLEASWRTKAADEARVNALQQRFDHLQKELEQGHAEVKGVLKKCLDTQHLLSGTVVALQSEVEEVKRRAAASTHKNREMVSTAMYNLLERQSTLKNALQLLQACALEAQRASEDQCSMLADRLDAVEARTDDLVRICAL